MAIPPWITCSGGNSSISIFGSGSKWLFLFFLVGHSYACSKTFIKHIIGKPFKQAIFWYQNQGYWMNDNKVMVASRHLMNN